MSLHIGDYLKNTRHLRADGHGAYLLLIMHYWSTGGLPSDDRQLASIAALSDREWKNLRPTLQAFFEPGWKHKRIEKELAEAQLKYEKRAAAGKRGGEAKAGAKQSSSNAKPMPEQPITLTDKELGGGGSAGERPAAPVALSSPLVSAKASQIAEEMAQIAGFPDPTHWPPGWCGAPMRIQAMLNEGWDRDAMVSAVQGAMRGRKPQSLEYFSYFEKPIARAQAESLKPLPIVEIQAAETVHVQPGSRGNILASQERLIERVAAFGPRPGGEPGPSNVRLLSKG